ncbi:MAG: DUF2997 domain-containing protein [Pirellulales bacterium]|nr:DUF2997 domain-containing protein [Pirellulales bacterium]
MTRVIEILVSPEGQTQLQTRGIAGPSCQEASRFLETALGQVTAEQRTAEYHLPATRAPRLQTGSS